MIDKRSLARVLRLLFYACLDVTAGTVIYIISLGEDGLTSGQLAIRVLTGMALASAIVGGPDIMLYWQESGRRIAAEDERDAAVEKEDAATKRADAAEEERDAVMQRLDELSAEMEQLRNERAHRRTRRRRLRGNGQ